MTTSRDPRSNSFGFLRLALATTVIVSHTWPLGGFGSDPGRASNNLGILAVEAFFALSGYLITRSGTRLSTGRFLWHRIVRIFPGFWVSLVVVAFVFAPIVWVGSRDIASYASADPPALGFVVNNWLLHLGQFGIGGTLDSVPYTTLWNGPLYTLSFEFFCYLVIAILVTARMVNARIVAILTIVTWVWLQVLHLGVAGAVDEREVKFIFCFMVGALIHFLRDRIITRNLVLPIAAGLIAGGTYVFGGFIQIGLVAFVYLCIWLGTFLPFHGIGRKRDISYGMYIYGWPVQQLSSHFGANELGLVPYLAIVLGATVVLATASWYLVESQAMRLKDAPVAQWLRDGTLRWPRKRGPVVDPGGVET